MASSFTPGLDPGLLAWLRMRESARKIKEQQGDLGLPTSVICEQTSRYHSYWLAELNDSLSPDDPRTIEQQDAEQKENRVSFQQFENMIYACQHSAIPRRNILKIVSIKKSNVYLDLFLKASMNINWTVDESGRTLLHIATRDGDELKVAYLLEKGAAPNMKDKDDNTPLHLSIQEHSAYHTAVIVEALLDKGANIDAQNKKGYTALHLACILDARMLIELLVKRKAAVHLLDKVEKMPIDHLAHKVNMSNRSMLLCTALFTSLRFAFDCAAISCRLRSDCVSTSRICRDPAAILLRLRSSWVAIVQRFRSDREAITQRLRRYCVLSPQRFCSDSAAIAQRFRIDCDAIAQRFRSDSAAIPQRLRSDCVSDSTAIALRFCSDCVSIPQRMRSDCVAIVCRFRSDCAAIAQRLCSDCVSILQQSRRDYEVISRRFRSNFAAILQRSRSDCDVIATRFRSDCEAVPQ
jgi:ankyrin repeat protein